MFWTPTTRLAKTLQQTLAPEQNNLTSWCSGIPAGHFRPSPSRLDAHLYARTTSPPEVPPGGTNPSLAVPSLCLWACSDADLELVTS